MSTENTENKSGEVVKRGRKKHDLSTAKVADGALKSPNSVYEMVGISTSSYKSRTLEEYKETLASMNLMELQEEAYRHATPATDNREIIIDRLERKFLQENSRFVSASKQTVKKLTAEEHIKNQALNILRRGK